MPIDTRVICSTITFRRLPLSQALSTIRELGFTAIDLGALPGVCDHVPADLDDSAIEAVAQEVLASGLDVRSINADIGDLNAPVDEATLAARDAHTRRLVALARRVASPAIVLPCGAQSHEPLGALDADLDRVATALRRAAGIAEEQGVEIWVEVQHSLRLAWSMERAVALAERLTGSGVGLVLDFSHVVAAGDDPLDWIAALGDRVSHVHIRDAVKGDIHRTPGNGDADFESGLAALRAQGYRGAYSLELETDDVANEDRPRSAAASARLIESYV